MSIYRPGAAPHRTTDHGDAGSPEGIPLRPVELDERPAGSRGSRATRHPVPRPDRVATAGRRSWSTDRPRRWRCTGDVGAPIERPANRRLQVDRRRSTLGTVKPPSSASTRQTRCLWRLERRSADARREARGTDGPFEARRACDRVPDGSVRRPRRVRRRGVAGRAPATPVRRCGAGCGRAGAQGEPGRIPQGRAGAGRGHRTVPARTPGRERGRPHLRGRGDKFLPSSCGNLVGSLACGASQAGFTLSTTTGSSGSRGSMTCTFFTSRHAASCSAT